MAGDIFPGEAPRPTRSHAERRVYEALARGLPDGWRAWHSLKLRIAGAWEGEGDFVIAAPDRGLVVLEVKGGRITLSGGHWLQNGQRLDRSPREQGMTLARNLAREIQAREADAPPYDAACAFPDVDFSDGPRTGDLTGLVLGPHELDWLGAALPALFDRALGSRPAPRNRKWLHIVHELWGETWAPHVRLEDKVERACERAIELDREQLRLLDMAGQISCALVTGRAGSGKTVVARELCARRARAGSRALYLCFTEALALAVDRGFEPLRQDGHDLRAAPIRRYAADLLGATGDRSKEFWDQVCLRAAESLPDPRPDLVVIDEAQDLDENDWLLVSELAAGRDLWVFLDDAQRFWTERDLPPTIRQMAGAPLVLPHQHRSPDRIDQIAALYRNAVTEHLAQRPTGHRRARRPSALQTILTPTDQLLPRVGKQLDTLRSQGARPADIAVLTLAGQTKSDLLARDHLGSHRLRRADAPDAATEIIADTFLRFKGLERPFVIITEVTRGNLSHYDTRMHIALTRATVSAIIVCTGDALAADPRLATLVADHG
jgi:hypothetical protein